MARGPRSNRNPRETCGASYPLSLNYLAEYMGRRQMERTRGALGDGTGHIADLLPLMPTVAGPMPASTFFSAPGPPSCPAGWCRSAGQTKPAALVLNELARQWRELAAERRPPSELPVGPERAAEEGGVISGSLPREGAAAVLGTAAVGETSVEESDGVEIPCQLVLARHGDPAAHPGALFSVGGPD